MRFKRGIPYNGHPCENESQPSNQLSPQPFQRHERDQEQEQVMGEEKRTIATLKKTDGLAERIRLKQDICARKIQIILVTELSFLSPGDIPEDYLLWFNLCGKHGVKLATPDRVFDPNQYIDWVRLLVEAGFDREEIKEVERERNERNRESSTKKNTALYENPPYPYIYDSSLGGLTIDFEGLQQLEKIWELAVRYSIPVVAEKAGLPVSIVRRSVSVERLLFYQGLWIDPETGELSKGHWPIVMNSQQASHILANRQRYNAH